MMTSNEIGIDAKPTIPSTGMVMVVTQFTNISNICSELSPKSLPLDEIKFTNPRLYYIQLLHY